MSLRETINMKAIDNVFPLHIEEDRLEFTEYGLTARDYIAIQAMTGISANPNLTNWTCEQIAELAYKQADAMIAQSEVKSE